MRFPPQAGGNGPGRLGQHQTRVRCDRDSNVLEGVLLYLRLSRHVLGSGTEDVRPAHLVMHGCSELPVHLGRRMDAQRERWRTKACNQGQLRR